MPDQITAGDNRIINNNRGQWIRRIVIILLIVAAAPAIIGAVAMLVSHGVHAFGQIISSSVSSFSSSLTSGDRIGALTKLCLWLIVIIFALRILVRR